MAPKNFELNDQTIQQLFGVDDAENEDPDRLKAFFFKNKAYKNLKNDLPIRIVVGHKGIGKSALLKMCSLEDEEDGKPSIWIKPDKLLDVSTDGGFNAMISEWKTKLRSLIVTEFTGEKHGLVKTMASGIINDILSLAKQHNMEGTQAALLKNLHEKRKISVYIDDLDRGWEAQRKDVTKISTLLNAIRDLSGENPKVRFLIALRTDVYQLVRTSDESTDKIEQNIINLSWDNHEILYVMASRVNLFFNPTSQQASPKMLQPALFKFFEPIIEKRFHGAGKWANAPMHRVLLSLTRKRPRDLIKLLSSAAKEAYKNNRNRIVTSDLRDTFNNYSQERMQDLINEFKSELPKIERLILGMRPTKREKTALDAFLYDKGSLIAKIKEIMEHNHFYFANKSPVTPQALAEFLYRIDFITARKDSDTDSTKIARVYYSQNKNLMGQEDFGYKWEIHPAYRWALRPSAEHKIFENIDL